MSTPEPPRSSALNPSRTLYGGMDVHQASIAVASVAADHGAEVISRGTIGTRHADIEQLVRTRQSTVPPLSFVYAAGPWGSWRSRELAKNSHVCGVVAPSLLPNKAGDRVTTDHRDAVPLARLLRAGDLTPSTCPEDAAMRALTRAREDALRDRKAAQCRLKAFWLRQDIR